MVNIKSLLVFSQSVKTATEVLDNNDRRFGGRPMDGVEGRPGYYAVSSSIITNPDYSDYTDLIETALESDPPEATIEDLDIDLIFAPVEV